MASPKSCAILGHNPMRFAWGFDEEAAECHDMKMELAQILSAYRSSVRAELVSTLLPVPHMA